MTPGRLARAVQNLTDLGLRPVVGPLATAGARQVAAADRAEELNAFLRDESIRAVIATIGGYTSNGLLPLIDYDALAADPKVIIGYSDITAILLGIHARTGLITFHGPTALPELGEFPRPLTPTTASLLAAVRNTEPIGELMAAVGWTDEFLAWDQDDDRPRELAPSRGWRFRGEAVAVGPIVGGNLDTLCALTGTPFLPDLTGAILLWETLVTSLDRIDQCLNQLAQSGALDGIVGMLVGRTFRGGPSFESEFGRYLEGRFDDPSLPVVTGMDIGHADPMLTIPIGVRGRIDPFNQRVEILDAAVR